MLKEIKRTKGGLFIGVYKDGDKTYVRDLFSQGLATEITQIIENVRLQYGLNSPEQAESKIHKLEQGESIRFTDQRDSIKITSRLSGILAFLTSRFHR